MKFNLQKIKGLMAEKHITQEELAPMIPLSKSTLNAKLNGKKPLSIKELCRILTILEYNIEKISEFFLK